MSYLYFVVYYTLLYNYSQSKYLRIRKNIEKSEENVAKKMNSEQLTQYYRWQFLRLNPEYRKFYELIQKEIAVMEKNQNIHPEAKRQIINTDILSDLYKFYGLNQPVNYKLKNLPSGAFIDGQNRGGIKKISLQDFKQEHPHIEYLEYPPYLLERNENGWLLPVAIQVIIDLKSPIQDIKKDFNEVIKSAKLYPKRAIIGRTRAVSSVVTLNRYLQVFKMRYYKKMKNITVAKKVFKLKEIRLPDGQRSNDGEIRRGEDLTNKAFEEAKALVFGGYKKISFNPSTARLKNPPCRT